MDSLLTCTIIYVLLAHCMGRRLYLELNTMLSVEYKNVLREEELFTFTLSLFGGIKCSHCMYAENNSFLNGTKFKAAVL